MVDAVRKYATEHEGVETWDYVTEVMSDLDIAKVVTGSPSDRMALYKLVKYVDGNGYHFSD